MTSLNNPDKRQFRFDSCKFALSEAITYPDLVRKLGIQANDKVPLSVLRKAVLALRKQKGMLLDSEDKDTWSVGSFFINPIVSSKIALSLPPDAPKWNLSANDRDTIIPLSEINSKHHNKSANHNRYSKTVNSDMFKLSAAWLIQASGINRSFSLPQSDAAISSKHTLAITNR